MKLLITCVVSLLSGLAIGWHLRGHHAEHEAAEIVQQMVQMSESLDAAEAARDARAIDLVGSGDAQQARRVED